MADRLLSSAQTVVTKFIFPAFWIGGFGAGTAMLWFADLQSKNGPPPPELKWLFLTVWIAGGSFILWLCSGLKKVTLRGDSLIVSNYLKEISIPLTMVEHVSENRWINIHPVTIRLRAPTEFGSEVTFMPKARLIGWTSHPVVAELRKAAKLPPE